MSISETSNGQSAAPAACAECGEPLGVAGRFCPNCGHAVSAPPPAAVAAAASGRDAVAPPAPVADAPTVETPVVTPPAPVADAPAVETPVVTPAAAPAPAASAPAAPAAPPPASAPPSPAPGAPRRRLLVGLAIAGAVIVVAAIAFVALGSGGGDDEATVYKTKVAAAFGPILGANRQASDSLAALVGTDPAGGRAADARAAVRRAQQSVTLATGAVSALQVPAADDQLARDARQVLDGEAAYYQAVGRVLDRPASTSTGNVTELAANLTSALSVAGPTVAGTQPTVSGADHLVGWARRIRIRADRAKARRRVAPRGSGSGSSAPVQSAPSTGPVVVPSRSTDCGGGVFAGPNTSCAFAINVRRAWLDAPGSTNTLRVFSPVTGVTYTMACGPSGRGITCTGGNNASVTFDG